MSEGVQVVDLRAQGAGSRSRRSSVRQRHSDPPQPQPTRGRTMSSASEARRSNAVPIQPQSTSRAPPLRPPPPPLVAAALAAAPGPAPISRPNYVQRVPVTSATPTVTVTGPPNQVRVHRRSSTSRGAPTTGAFVSKPNQGRPRRSSSASRRTPATTPTTPTTPVSSSNVKLRNKTAKEQVMYVPSGQPLVIVDERRTKNTPLPTVIRDGKVIMGGDGRTRAQLVDTAHTIVRSDPGTSMPNGGTTTRRRRNTSVARNVPQSRFTEVDATAAASRPHSRRNSVNNRGDVVVGGAPLQRRKTWGHGEKRDPPLGHHDFRCRSPWHGLKDWWMGIFMLDGRRRGLGNTQYEEAHKERDSERRKREREFRGNVAAWRNGRRDVHLW